MTANCLKIFVCGLLLPLCGCAAIPPNSEPASWPRFTLEAEGIFPLNPPGGARFDASGLLLTAAGDLITLSDREAALYRIQLPRDSASASLAPMTNVFTTAQMSWLLPAPRGHYDCEGVAQDRQGRFYVCEEGNRWILRCDPNASRVERLPIDWSPVKDAFSSARNASFEGVAVGDGKLYVANERSSPLLIVVDLGSFQVVDHFVVSPQTGSFLGMLHYSDLSWHDGKLFVLCRHHRVVLEVEPATHAVLAEFDYREIEDRLGYQTDYPTGIMEGLAVDRDFIWLVTDNNGLARRPFPNDIRPTLLKCPRPDRR